jgi:hypothetical protein
VDENPKKHLLYSPKIKVLHVVFLDRFDLKSLKDSSKYSQNRFILEDIFGKKCRF